MAGGELRLARRGPEAGLAASGSAVAGCDADVHVGAAAFVGLTLRGPEAGLAA
jgi:hypothetical protein